MRTNCKSCGAPLNEKKCDYCGTVHNDWRQTVQATASYENPQNLDTPQNNVENFDVPIAKNKLAINTFAGIFAGINVLVLTYYNSFLLGDRMPTDDQTTMLGFLIFAILAMMIVALVIHIIGLVRSRKHGIAIAGHVLGIIGSLITLLTLTILSFLSIVLFFLATILILQQRNVRRPVVEKY